MRNWRLRKFESLSWVYVAVDHWARIRAGPAFFFLSFFHYLGPNHTWVVRRIWVLESVKMAITAGRMANSQECRDPVRSGWEVVSRQPQPFIRVVLSDLELQCDSMLEKGEVIVGGINYSESGKFGGLWRRWRQELCFTGQRGSMSKDTEKSWGEYLGRGDYWVTNCLIRLAQ